MANGNGEAGGRLSWLHLVLLIPYVAVLWVPFYNRVEPAWQGIPFFYWYQLLWVILGGVIVGLVYFATEREDNDDHHR
jgi:hypothetical protein